MASFDFARLRLATPVLSLSKGSGRTVFGKLLPFVLGTLRASPLTAAVSICRDNLPPFVLSVASPEPVEGRAKSKDAMLHGDQEPSFPNGSQEDSSWHTT